MEIKEIIIKINIEDAKKLADDLSSVFEDDDPQWEDNGIIYAPSFSKQINNIVKNPKIDENIIDFSDVYDYFTEDYDEEAE